MSKDALSSKLYGINENPYGNKGRLRRIFEELNVFDKIEFVNQEEAFRISFSGDLIREMGFSAHYKLKLDEEENIKIKHLWLFAQYPSAGEKSIFEMYEEEMMEFFKDKEM